MVAGVFWGDLVSRGHTELSIDSQQLETSVIDRAPLSNWRDGWGRDRGHCPARQDHCVAGQEDAHEQLQHKNLSVWPLQDHRPDSDTRRAPSPIALLTCPESYGGWRLDPFRATHAPWEAPPQVATEVCRLGSWRVETATPDALTFLPRSSIPQPNTSHRTDNFLRGRRANEGQLLVRHEPEILGRTRWPVPCSRCGTADRLPVPSSAGLGLRDQCR